MKNRNKTEIFTKKNTSFLLIVLASVLLIIGFVWIHFDNARIRKERARDSIVVDGQTYYEKDNMLNILVLGIDLRGEIENKDHVIGNNGQADMLCVVSIDKETQEVTILSIPRETMVMLDVREDAREKKEHKNGQICLQYAYATSSERGAELTRDRVEELLGVPIHNYVAISMGGIATLVDDVGGVDVFMSKDYLVPSFLENSEVPEWIQYKSGDEVSMNGAEAYEFVHYRDTEHYATNLDRMDRQRDFLFAFIESTKKTVKTNLSAVGEIAKDLQKYMTTDLKASEYSYFAKLAMKLQPDRIEIKRIPGEDVHVGLYDEYHVNNEELLDMLLDIFYEKI